MTVIRPRRSFLFVAGTHLEMVPKALRAGPDIVCVDLEDAIAPDDKAAARERTVALFEARPDFTGELLIRINGVRSPDGLADLLAVAKAAGGPDALMLPKVKCPDEVALIADVLETAGKATRLQVIIESNEGLQACHEIARASPRVDALLFGGIDMAAELRVEPTWEALLYARQRVVHAAAAAGIDVIDVPFLDLEDMAGLEQEAKRAAAIGMTGKGAIHPKQLEIITRTFTPDPATVVRAERIVRAFAEAGTGLVVIDGKLIEKPVLRSMQRILRTAKAPNET